MKRDGDEKRVRVRILSDGGGRGLNVRKGDEFEGWYSKKPDWLVGCHYVMLSPEDAAKVGEDWLAEGWSCEVVGSVDP